MSYIKSFFSPTSSPLAKQSPSNKTKKSTPSQHDPPESPNPLASPIKYLLQNNLKLNMGKDSERTPQQLELITRLLQECTIFPDLQIPISDPSLSKELSKGIVLLYCESPHIMQVKDNELYVFFEGQGFEYMQNNFSKQGKKYHIYENNQYIMLRKINTNEYFLSMQDHNNRYHKEKKYQLMVDQNTLIGKFSEEIFHRVFFAKIGDRQRNVIAVLKKVQIFNGLPSSFFHEFSKFVSEEKRGVGEKVISREEKSKFVYFVKSGTAEMHYFNQSITRSNSNQNYYISNNRPYSLHPINPFDSFGMEAPQSPESEADKEVICTSECVFLKIDKRLLAIIITSFELQFQQKNKVWSQVNINNQIKGQNYCSPQKELLLKNVQRIRTSQRKIRDIKLKYLSSNKSKKDIEPCPLPKQELIKESIQEEKQPERKRMIKTTEGRFRSTSIIKFINNFGGIDDEKRYNAIRMKLQEERQKFIADRVNQIELVPLETDDLRPTNKLRLTNAFEYKERLENNKMTRSTSKFQRYDSANRFVPRMQVKSSTPHTSTFKADSEMIGVFLDKKIKNEIMKKAERVCNINKNVKLAENKNLKRLFAAGTASNRQINAISQIDKKSIAQDIVDKMSNLRQNPLLLQIESERRKLQRQLKLSSRRAKAPESPSPKKYKKQDQLILIKDYS